MTQRDRARRYGAIARTGGRGRPDPLMVALAATALLLASVAAFGQSAQSGGNAAPPASTPDSGVIRPPAQVDPGIKAKPPVPSAALPTPVIPPPGAAGGNTAMQPK